MPVYDAAALRVGVRLAHPRDAATKAISYLDGRSRRALDDDELLRLALTKLVEIVGEVTKQVSAETRGACPNVPWSAAARMRDRLIHHYFDINLDVLWTTIVDDLAGAMAGGRGDVEQAVEGPQPLAVVVAEPVDVAAPLPAAPRGWENGAPTSARRRLTMSAPAGVISGVVPCPSPCLLFG